MLFNSLQFALFLPAVVVGYWLLRRKPPRYQNLLLLPASYLFYAWWGWRLLGLFGLKAGRTTLEVILPLGISFFTFKSLSYSIDVFRKKCSPTRDAVAYS